MVEHKQITVFDPASNGAIEVDEGIAPLLKAIWFRNYDLQFLPGEKCCRVLLDMSISIIKIIQRDP